jgi:hypothetical protein
MATRGSEGEQPGQLGNEVIGLYTPSQERQFAETGLMLIHSLGTDTKDSEALAQVGELVITMVESRLVRFSIRVWRLEWAL